MDIKYRLVYEKKDSNSVIQVLFDNEDDANEMLDYIKDNYLLEYATVEKGLLTFFDEKRIRRLHSLLSEYIADHVYIPYCDAFLFDMIDECYDFINGKK